MLRVTYANTIPDLFAASYNQGQVVGKSLAPELQLVVVRRRYAEISPLYSYKRYTPRRPYKDLKRHTPRCEARPTRDFWLGNDTLQTTLALLTLKLQQRVKYIHIAFTIVHIYLVRNYLSYGFDPLGEKNRNSFSPGVPLERNLIILLPFGPRN